METFPGAHCATQPGPYFISEAENYRGLENIKWPSLHFTNVRQLNCCCFLETRSVNVMWPFTGRGPAHARQQAQHTRFGPTRSQTRKTLDPQSPVPGSVNHLDLTTKGGDTANTGVIRLSFPQGQRQPERAPSQDGQDTAPFPGPTSI